MDIVNIFDDILDNEIRHRTYTIRQRPNHMNIWTDEEFFNRFRLKKLTVIHLLQQIEAHIRPRTNRNRVLSSMEQLLLTLRFYASGSFYIVLGDFVGVNKSTAGRVIKKISEVIANLCPQYIKLPRNARDIQKVQREFYEISLFPLVISALDGTLIKIQSPEGGNAENYRNRKGYFALNIQAMCDANYKFTNIVARWPGSTHDRNIFNNSNVRFEFERGDYEQALVLGDAGYPVRSYLLIPLGNPQTPAEALYNEAHIRTRNVIERTFGIWERRFPIVGLGMRCQIPLAQKIIVATAILHNIARGEHEEPPFDPELHARFVEQLEIDAIHSHPRNENDRVRRQLINYFANL